MPQGPCACGGVYARYAAEGPAWTAMDSEHVLLRTDLPLRAARVQLERIERAYSALDALLRPPGAGPGADVQPVELVLFERLVDYRALIPNESVASYRHDSA